MKVVKVYGALKERLGGQGTFELDVFSAAEAIKALCSNFAGLDKWFIDSSDDGIAYKVLLGKTRITADNLENLLYPWSEKEVFHITPVVMGAIQLNPFKWKNKGLRNLVIGLTIVGIGFATGGLGFTWAGGISGWAGAHWAAKAAIYIGASIALGGISEMLTPVPKPPPEANKLKSFSFSGIEQTTQQGGPIPIVYGKCFVGSAVLSSGVDTFDG
tara:strand:+ start:24 stop:668 length:645 start_codon:yes stop_codon:yes gene_type:complete